MPEYQSVLRASKTKDGGATAELVVNAPDGPVRFAATVAPKTAESIRQAIFSWVHAGQPDQAKKVAKAAVMGADPDDLAEPSYKDTGVHPDTAKPNLRKHHRYHGGTGGKKGGLVSFKPDPDDVAAPTTFDAESPTTSTGLGMFVGLADDAVMGCALRALRDRTPPKFQKALSSAAMNAANARKRAPVTTSGDTFKFYEDEELANPMDQLSQWVPPPLGVPKSFEEAAVISGEHEEAVAISGYGADLVSRQRIHALGRRAKMAGEDVNEIKLAKYAVIDLWNKKKPGQLKAVKYAGATPEGKYTFQTVSKDGKENTFDVSKSDAGYAVFKKTEATVQGEDAPIMPSTVDVKDAKNVLVKWYGSKKPGTLQAVSYQGVSPVSNKLKFLAKTSEGLQGYEMERSDIGWRATAMSGDEVGLFGFIKKAAGAVASAAKGVGKGVASATTAVAKGAYKYGKKGVTTATKYTEKGLKAVGKLAMMAALGPLIIPMRKYLSSHGIGPLATRRANFLAFQASGGKVRKATPDQVKAQIPWAKSHFSSKIPSFLRTIVSGDCPDHVIIRRTAMVGGSYARFDMLAPGDNLRATPFVGGVDVNVPTKYGHKKRKYVKVASFTLPVRHGVIGDDAAPAQAAPSAPPPSLGSIISAPFHWLGNIIGTILGSPSVQQQAPAQLPASTDDGSLADQSAAMDDGSMSPDASSPDAGTMDDGSMAPDDGSSYDDSGTYDDGSMSGTFVGKHGGKHGGKGPHTGQGGQLFKKLGDAITAAGVPMVAGTVWDRATTAKVAAIARQVLARKKIGRLLRAFVKKSQIKITLPNGAVMGDVYGAPPAAPPPMYPTGAPPAAPPPALPTGTATAWRGAPVGPKGASRRKHHRHGRQTGTAVTTGLRRGGTGTGTGTSTVMTTVMSALTAANINVNQGTIWTQDTYNSAISAAVSALTTNKASLPAKAQAKNPNSLGRALVKSLIRRRAILVQGKNGQFYTIKAANGQWVLDTTSTPPDFTAKLTLVRNTFATERDRQHNLIVSQNRDDSNFNQSVGLAKSSLQTAGLPIDQIRLSPQGTLLAGTFIVSSRLGAFDMAERDADNFVETGEIKPSDEESEKAMFNDSMWIDKDVIEKKEVAELDDQIDDDADDYGTSERALWMRPALVGTFVGDTDPATGLDKLWWQPLQYFQDSAQKVYNAAALATSTAATAAPSGGGGGGGGPSGGGGGGGDDGGGGGDDAAPDDGGGDAPPPDGGGDDGGGGGEMDPADYERAQEAEG